MLHKTSARRRWAALTSGVLLTGGLVAGPALGGLVPAQASSTAGTLYNCTYGSFPNLYPVYVDVDITPATAKVGESLTPTASVTMAWTDEAATGFRSLGLQVKPGTAPTFKIATATGGKAGTTTLTLPEATLPESGDIVWTGSGSWGPVDTSVPGELPMSLGSGAVTATVTLKFTPGSYSDQTFSCTIAPGADTSAGAITVDPAAAPAISVATQPTVSGQATVGKTVSVVDGSYEPADVAVSHQWLRNGVAIPGATAASYAVAPGDLGKTLSVRVTASKTGYANDETTVPVGKVAPGTLAVSGKAKVSGTPKVGKTLKAVPGKAAGAKVSYQWLANGKAVTKATKSSLKLTKALKGKKVSVKATYTKTGFLKVTQTSKALKIKK